MGLPPTHRVDHVPRIVLSFDDAWDHARINREIGELAAKRSHPWAKFVNYESRGDLSTVQHLLQADPPSPPLVFELRRMTIRENAIVENRQITSAPAGRNLALGYTLISVEGAKLEFDRGGRDLPHGLSDADLDKLRALVGDQGMRELGNHAIACSRMELTSPEKKP